MAGERWNDDIAYAMTPLKLIMWPMGGWPLQVYNVFSLIRCVAVTCGMSVIVILPSIELYLGCADADRNVDALMLAVCGILAMSKMIWFRIQASNLTETYKFAVNDYLTVENAQQRAIMLRQAFIAKTLMYILVTIAYADTFILALIPFVGGNGKVINGTDDIFLEYTIPSKCTLEYLDASRSMHTVHCIIELIMLFLVSTSNFGSIYFLSNDSLFLHIALHICGQVKILKSKFTEFDLTAPQIYDRFNVLIQRHGRLIKITKVLSNAISFILLIQLFLSSILLCILGFQLILALNKNVITMVKSFMIFKLFLAQVTTYCVIGDNLKSHMEEVASYIYQTAWYKLPANLMKNLTFIIMRSQSPVQLQAGSFIVLNLETFMSILKTSISYLSVLRVMVET